MPTMTVVPLSLPPALPSRRKRLIFSVIAVLLGILVLEVLARVLIAPWTPPESLPFHPRLLWSMSPGTHRMAGVEVRINSLGLRGPEVEVPRPPQEKRILVLGDSSIFGFGVTEAANFSSQLQQVLNAQPGRDRVTVINGGMVGYSSLQSIELLRMTGETLQPNLLIIASLWSDNNFDGFTDKALLEQLNSPIVQRNTASRNLLRNSRLFVGLERLISGQPVQQVSWVHAGEVAKPGKAQRRVKLEDYAQNLRTLVTLAREHHTESMLMVLPHPTDVSRVPENLSPWGAYREAMRAVGKNTGAPVIELPQTFSEAAAQAITGDTNATPPSLFLDDLHPSAAGHALMATTVATLLTENGWRVERPVMGTPTGSPLPVQGDPFVDYGKPVEPGTQGALRILQALSPQTLPAAVPGPGPIMQHPVTLQPMPPPHTPQPLPARAPAQVPPLEPVQIGNPPATKPSLSRPFLGGK